MDSIIMAIVHTRLLLDDQTINSEEVCGSIVHLH